MMRITYYELRLMWKRFGEPVPDFAMAAYDDTETSLGVGPLTAEDHMRDGSGSNVFVQLDGTIRACSFPVNEAELDPIKGSFRWNEWYRKNRWKAKASASGEMEFNMLFPSMKYTDRIYNHGVPQQNIN